MNIIITEGHAGRGLELTKSGAAGTEPSNNMIGTLISDGVPSLQQVNFKWLIAVVLICLPIFLPGQSDGGDDKLAPPEFMDNRADEDYSFLRDSSSNTYQNFFADDLKFLPIGKSNAVYLTLGGEYRPRYEYFSSVNYSAQNESIYLQRLAFHAKLNLGKHLSFFGELYHGYVSGEEAFPKSDVIDLHQGFMELTIPTSGNGTIGMRLGRQELKLGATRLVGNRNGPNIRRSFDLAKLTYDIGSTTVAAFYGNEVNVGFEAFDNSFNLFDEEATNPKVWSVGAQFPFKGIVGRSEVYYLGFKAKAAGFSDIFGEEVRHTVGLRRFGSVGRKFSYNSEFIYQFGDLAGSSISAFNIEFDFKYRLENISWTPQIGLKFDWSSGDQETGDGKLQTFNPLFVNPGLYSLAAVNTPVNLTSFHPNILLLPLKKVAFYLDYAIFFRSSQADGLYSPPRFQSRQAGGLRAKHIGDAIGANLTYTMNRNTSFELMTTYYIPGEFIKASGESNSIFYLAFTIDFLF